MIILVVGSGGREHAICRAFRKSPLTKKLFCADGNAGIASIAECVPIKPTEITRLAEFAEEFAVDLTFVGGEAPLALGITDEFERRGLRIVGVSQTAAQLESSKSFAKDFMAKHGVPTAKYKTAYCVEDALTALESGFFGDESAPAVVKADGLAGGKGVIVAPNRAAAADAIRGLADVAGVDAAEKIVIEECLFGREVSLLLFSDGKSHRLMPPVRDHKRVGEGDTGPNTGGMGTVSDDGLLTAEQLDEIVGTIVEPSLRGARDDGFPIRGILFIGLMMTDHGPQVLEYNVRFGDPETQVILIRLETDFVEVCNAIVEGKLDAVSLRWSAGSAACVVMAARNYPSKPQTGDVIHGLGLTRDLVEVFHAGTARGNLGEILTDGGRVLGVTARGADLDEALARTYEAVGDISWDGMQFRRDIGRSVG